MSLTGLNITEMMKKKYGFLTNPSNMVETTADDVDFQETESKILNGSFEESGLDSSTERLKRLTFQAMHNTSSTENRTGSKCSNVKLETERDSEQPSKIEKFSVKKSTEPHKTDLVKVLRYSED